MAKAKAGLRIILNKVFQFNKIKPCTSSEVWGFFYRVQNYSKKTQGQKHENPVLALLEQGFFERGAAEWQ